MKASTALVIGKVETKVSASKDCITDSIRNGWATRWTKEVLPMAHEKMMKLLCISAEEKERCDSDEMYSRSLLESLAENIAVDNLICPPSWTGSLSCKSCGIMPWLPDLVEEPVESCPWCHSAGRKSWEFTKQHVEATKLITSAEHSGWELRYATRKV